MTDSRLVTINQMILATLFGVGVILFMFCLVFFRHNIDQVTITIVSNLLSVLGTVIVMQNTHFFKPGDNPAQSGVPNAPVSTPVSPIAVQPPAA